MNTTDNTSRTSKEQRIEDCKRLFIKYNGREHERIEFEMRALGHENFHRRALYDRFTNGKRYPGWISRFGWEDLFTAETPGRRERKICPQMNTDGHRYRNSPCETSSSIGIHPCSSVDENSSQRLGVSAVKPTDNFHAWLKSLGGNAWNWDWKHLKYIYTYLKKITDGESKRLMIFMPPRHGKSELVTVRYSAFRLCRDPQMSLIVAGYNQQLANRFSRKIKHVLFDAATLEEAFTAETQSRGEKNIGPQMNTDKHRCSNCRSTGPSSAEIGVHQCSSVDKNSSLSPGVSAVNTLPGYLPAGAVRPRRINSAAEWETNAGGAVRAVGVGGGVTGFGAQLVIIDDPIKSRAEVESKRQRDKLWDWYKNDIRTRLEPDGTVILIQTRWHEDDLAGRLLKEMDEGGDRWDVISLPAIAEADSTAETQRRGGRKISPQINTDAHRYRNLPFETSSSIGVHQYSSVDENSSSLRLGVSAVKTSDPLGRVQGEALCPERFDIPELEDTRRELGTYAFSALYQQTPVPADGAIFKRSWFTRIVDKAPSGLQWKRGYDLAVSTKTTADYTASFRVAFDKDGTLYIDGGFRRRIEFPEQRRYILGRFLEETGTEHGIELSLHGRAIMQDLRAEASARGCAFRGVEVEWDKVTRALTWAPLAEDGKVVLVRGLWHTEFIEEAAAFPSGAHDDQIDAVSIAVKMCTKKKVISAGF